MANPLIEIQKFGQSIWYDNIRRGLITSGELQSMVNEAGVLGVTSNPAIFTAAITGSPDYDQAVQALADAAAGAVEQFFEKRKAGAQGFAATVLSWQSKWHLVKSLWPSADREGHRKFIDAQFAKYIGSLGFPGVRNCDNINYLCPYVYV